MIDLSMLTKDIIPAGCAVLNPDVCHFGIAGRRFPGKPFSSRLNTDLARRPRDTLLKAQD
jgi:hypothetical protein